MQKCIDKNLVACQKQAFGGAIVDFQPPALDVSTFFLLFYCFGYVALFRQILVIYPCAKSPCIQQFFPVCRLHSVNRCELKVCCTSIACLLYKELYKKYERSSKSHCLFTIFRADVKSVPCPLYRSFVVLWGLLWN